ncbi:MAG TPA: TRAP transporter substrate-binding protein [Xanthobacteraceae bacterium]|nr:TRAP transporter substrate-binding protein [Xanthobacteraceae bacterium]
MRHHLHHIIAGIGLAAVLGMAGATPSGAADVTLKLGHAVFQTHPNHDTAVRFKEAVERLSNGSVKIQIYPSRQLGDVKELMEGVQFGTVDMTVNATSALATLEPAVDAFQLPFVIDSYDHFAKLAVSPEAKAINEGLEKHGMVALGVYDGGRRHFLSVKKPVVAAEDLKGLKTRVAPNRLFLDTWKAIGVNPTPLNYGEVYSALETGALDAVEINLTSIDSEKYYEVGKNVTLTGHYFWPSYLLVNKAKLDSLTPEQQAAIRKAADEIVAPQVAAVAELDKKIIGQLKERGVNIIEPSKALLDTLKERTKPVVDAYVKKSPKIGAFVAASERLAP